jgi:hypothetical protein
VIGVGGCIFVADAADADDVADVGAKQARHRFDHATGWWRLLRPYDHPANGAAARRSSSANGADMAARRASPANGADVAAGGTM